MWIFLLYILSPIKPSNLAPKTLNGPHLIDPPTPSLQFSQSNSFACDKIQDNN